MAEVKSVSGDESTILLVDSNLRLRFLPSFSQFSIQFCVDCMEETKSFASPSLLTHHGGDGWQKVTYAKKHRKNNISDSSKLDGSSAVIKNDVFKGLEKHAEDRRRKLEAQRAASAAYDEDEIPVRSKKDRDDEDSAGSDAKESNAAAANGKDKPKKIKKAKITVPEAAAKIDADDLTAFLSSISVSFQFRFLILFY